jgi:predicted P-loop ATPase
MIKQSKRLHALGFAIHWLKSKDKMPIEKNWTTGPRKKWEKLKQTYRDGMNMGVRLGEASKLSDGFYLAVIDCDVKSTKPKHLKEMETKLLELGVDLAPTVLSGRGNGSRHLYIKTAEPIQPRRFSQSNEKVKVSMPSRKPSNFEKQTLSAKELAAGIRLKAAWEISIMGQGQQVVLPPSIHPDSGKPYTWDIELTSVDDIPEFVYAGKEDTENEDEVTVEDFKVVPVDLMDGRLSDDVCDLIISGEGVEDRSASCFKAAIAMVQAGFSDQEVLTVLTDRENFLGSIGYDHAQTSSRKRAARWLANYTLKKVKREFAAEFAFDEVSEEEAMQLKKLSAKDAAKQDKKEFGDYRKQLERTKNGEVKPTFRNIRLILTGEAGENFLAHNSFSVEDIWQLDTPWGSVEGKPATDKDPIKIKNWLSESYGLEPAVERIEEVLIFVADQSKFHPVRDYLDGLSWDGVERLGTWLTDYMGAEGPKKYLRAVGVKTLVGMVKRIYEPGCKFDHVLILEGKQGLGKSSAAAILASPWFSDTEVDFSDKDAVVNMQGVWVYEMGELSAMSKWDSNKLKAFITRSTDKIRPPYGKRSINFPRQSVFIGTTNQDEYLKDTTGNRRFWPVTVHTLERDALTEDRDQLLAEAIEYYRRGETTYLEDERLVKIATREQHERMETDVMVEVLEEFFEAPPEDFNEQAFTMNELIHSMVALNKPVKHDRQSQMRLANSLRSLGYKKIRKQVGGLNTQWWTK